jgi:glycine betaine/choline ABC-type transport system substrate-binding protein
VGGKAFTEQYIVAGVLTKTLEDAGYRVDQRLGLGSDIVYDAVGNGSIDIFMEYSGTLWANHMNMQDNPGREAIREAVTKYAEEHDGIASPGPSGFQNLYAFAMRRDRAEELGVRSIEDLIAIAGTLKCGADLEFFGRPEWHRVRDTYNIDFDQKLTFDAALMYTAVQDRQVDLITAYTTDGRVAAYDLVIIDDPRNALLPYDGIYFVSDKAAADPKFLETIEPIVDAISDEVMREANKLVDVEGRPISEAVQFVRDSIAAR